MRRGLLAACACPAAAPGDMAKPKVGDRLERVTCTAGYAAFVYATGLRSPDGLAFDSGGRLMVVEESAGRVTRIDEHGRHHVLIDGLHSPEGLAADPAGGFFVVEDVRDGRLLAVDAKGEAAVLAEHLAAPEGIALLGQTLYVTESTAQLTGDLFAIRTRVLALRRGEDGWSAPELLIECALPFSFSELLADAEGRLLIANEASTGILPLGILSLDEHQLGVFSAKLLAPEGLAWSAGGGFPLLVAEEDTTGAGAGRVSRVDAEGLRSTLATGLGTIEDVAVDSRGRVFVSEDSSGMIIELRPPPLAPEREELPAK